MPKIILERDKCIGCSSCVALCPKSFEMGSDMKSTLKNSNKNKENNFELETKEIDCIKDAAESCPVQIIHIIKD